MQARRWFFPLILVTAFLFILSLRQLSDPDLGFHLKYGKWIAEHHQAPVSDVSTYTVPGHVYVDLHWMFQLVLYGVYKMTGYPGISLLVCALALLLSLLLMLRDRLNGVPTPVTGLMLIAGFLVIDPRIAPRPEMFSFLFLAAILLILDRHAWNRRNQVFLLPAIMLLWCNMHALFILGLIVIIIRAAGTMIRRREWDRRLALAGLLSVLVCLVNPYGFRGIAFPVELLSRFRSDNVFNQHIQEFMPFFRQQTFVLHDWLFLGMALAVLLLMFMRRKEKRMDEYLLLILFGGLAFASIRNIPLFVIPALPFLASGSERLLTRFPGVATAFNTLAFWVMVILPLFLAPRILTNAYYLDNNSFSKTGMGLDLVHQPVASARFIADKYPQTRLLNSIGFGGWFSWVLPQPVFIDGRLEVIGESLYSEITESWDGKLILLINRYQPGLVVYNYLKYYPWTAQMSRMPGWRLVYIDGTAAVFSNDTDTLRIPTIDLHHLLSPGDAHLPGDRYTWLSGFYRQVDFHRLDLTHRMLFMQSMGDPPTPHTPDDAAIRCFNSANLKYRQGDLKGAEAAYDSAIAFDPAYVKAYNNRGILRASAFRDFHGALDDFNSAIRIDPDYSDAFLCRGTAYMLMKDLESACSDWHHAKSLGNPQAERLIELHCQGK